SWCARIHQRTRTCANCSAATARSGAPCPGRTSWSSLAPRGNRDLGTEVLEETKRGVPTGVVVPHFVGAERKALRGDERAIFHDQTLGQSEPWVDGLLRHRVTDVLGLDRERVAGADPRKFAVAIHFIGDV